MLKILIVVLVMVSVGLVAYDRGTKNAPPLNVNTQESGTAQNERELPIPDMPTPGANGTDEKTPTTGGANVLDLSGTGLTHTPQYVFEKAGTESLDLSNNKLTGSLQAEIRHLQSLRVLNLSNNQFTGVPAEIGQLKNLEVLDLSNNRLTGLPYELGNLSNLKVLDLRGNDYSPADLNIIQEKLPASTVIEID